MVCQDLSSVIPGTMLVSMILASTSSQSREKQTDIFVIQYIKCHSGEMNQVLWEHPLSGLRPGRGGGGISNGFTISHNVANQMLATAVGRLLGGAGRI